MGQVPVEGGGEVVSKFQVGDIIATNIEHPHLVLQILDKELRIDGQVYYRNGYRLLALNTGRITVIDIDQVDRECVPHDTLTQQEPKAFDGRMKLIDGGMIFHINEGVINLDMVPIKTVTIGYSNTQIGTVGVSGGGPLGGEGQTIGNTIWNPHPQDP